MKSSVRNIEAARQQVSEIRREMQRLERRARDLEDSLRAAAMELPIALQPEGTSGRKNRLGASKDVLPLKTARELTERVQRAMDLEFKRDAEIVIGVVVNALEQVLLSKLGTDGFAMKLGGFGKFKVRHVSPSRRKVGFSGKVVTTNAKRKIRFVALGTLRASEVAH